MAKLGTFQTPTGAKGSIFSPSDWLSLVVGAVVLIVTFAVGQDLAKKLGGVAPVDTTIDRPWKTPTVPQPENTQKQPSRIVL